jgi:hypothetical protein
LLSRERSEPGEDAFLVRAGEPGIAHDVGGQYRGQFAGFGHREALSDVSGYHKAELATALDGLRKQGSGAMAATVADQTRIVVEAETPGDSRTLFRVKMGEKLVGYELTAAETHLLVGEMLERIALPRKVDTTVK